MISTTVTRTCDMPHDKPRTGETVVFEFDKHEYELELCAKDKKTLERITAEYIPHARKIVKQNKTYVRRSTDRQRAADIRVWAKDKGLSVNGHGRIPDHVLIQYQASH